MKATTQKLSFVLILFSTIACFNGFAQTSAFTYQGKLDVNGAPANGQYDFNFRLLDDPIAGTAAPVTPTNLNVLVSNGLFTTAIDFGAQNFTGSPQWLEISVATNGGATFTPLSPRQLLTSTPYAIRSLSASNLLGVLPASQLSGTILPTNIANGTITSNLLANNSVNVNQLTTNIGVWTQSGTNIFYNAGKVGVGTTSPQATLQVVGNQPLRAAKVETSDPVGTWLNLANTSTGGGGWSLISSGPSNGEGPGQLLFHNNPNPNSTSGSTRMIINTNGFVGIGTITPQAKLQVAGSVIGGGAANSIMPGLIASTIAGGGVPGFPNTINGESSFIGAGNGNYIDTNLNNSFIGAGYANTIGSLASFIGSGNFNTIATNSPFSVIGGGDYNTLQPGANHSFIGGGTGNTIQTNTTFSVLAGGYGNGILPFAVVSSIGGGYLNTNAGFASTVPGGSLNAAFGDYSLAAGFRAKALDYGSFVWSDGQNVDFASTAANQFLIRAGGGVGIGTATPAAPLQIVSDNAFPHVKISAGSNAPFGAFLSMDATATAGGKEYFIFSTGASAGEGQGKLVFQDYTDGKQLMALTSDGNVGIGNVFPAAALDVSGSVRARGGLPGPGGTFNNGFMFSDPGDNDSGMSSSANGQIEFYSDSLEVMRIAQGGNVGIGTNSPQAKLHVNGDIKANGKIMMGPNGTNYATDSTEALRIVRGTISSTGAIVKGTGFTVSHPGAGGYTINFTTPFSDVPTITATAVNFLVRAGAPISASSVAVGTANFAGAPTDDSFHFIAIGPQ